MAHTAASDEHDELCRLDICPLRSSPPVASQPAVMACPGPNAEHKQVQECHYKFEWQTLSKISWIVFDCSSLRRAVGDEARQIHERDDQVDNQGEVLIRQERHNYVF